MAGPSSSRPPKQRRQPGGHGHTHEGFEIALRRISKQVDRVSRLCAQRASRAADRAHMLAGTDRRSPYYEPGFSRGDRRYRGSSSAQRQFIRREVRRRLRREGFRRSGMFGSVTRYNRFRRSRERHGTGTALLGMLIRFSPARLIGDLIRMTIVALVVALVLYYWLVRPFLQVVLPDSFVPGPALPGEESESLGESLPPNGMRLGGASLQESGVEVTLAAIRAAGFPAGEERQALRVAGAE